MRTSITLISSLTFGIAVGLAVGHGPASAESDTAVVVPDDSDSRTSPSLVSDTRGDAKDKVEYTWKIEEGVK